MPEYKRLLGHSIDKLEMSDLNWQIEASKIYEQIEDTRRWIVDKY